MKFTSVEGIKDILTGKIFVWQNTASYIFDNDEYAILPGDLSLLIRRNNIEWGKISPKHKYSIFRQDSNFVFRTYENEICPAENEFSISIVRNENETYTAMILSLKDEKEWLRLQSD